METRVQAKSPTTGLLLGLVITLAAVVVYSFYITAEIERLEDLQTELVDRNRRDSLQLLRIQNDLNSVAQAMRDMLDPELGYPPSAWESQFDRLRSHLDDALRIQDDVAVADQTPEQREYLRRSMNEFWSAVDRMFATVGREGEAIDANAETARTQIQSLQARQAALSNTVARLLVENNASEEAAAEQIAAVYAGVRSQVSLFLVATLSAILATGVYLIYSNRRVFQQISELSAQRSDLARTLIASQESTLRHISRDLHDEFGQVLTAVGSLLARARRKLGANSDLAGDLEEIREIAQSTLDNVRGTSQALHPAILEEGGLPSTVEWLVSSTRKHSGIPIDYAVEGKPFEVDSGRGIHVYRILQEALTNVARHSGAQSVSVTLEYRDDALVLEVEDSGRGFEPEGHHRGIGLTAMRERAELLGGALSIESRVASSPGTRVRLRVPRTELGPSSTDSSEANGSES